MSKRRPTDPKGLLRHYRPTRYEHEDREWMRPAVDAAEREILAAGQEDGTLIQRLAREEAWRVVKDLEEKDVRATHTFLRRVGRTGEWPLSVEEFEQEVWPSPIKIGILKVRFEVCQPSDFTDWELERRRADDKRTQQMLWEAAGAQTVVRWMAEQGVDLAGQLDKGAIPFADDEDDDDDDE